MIIIPAIDIMGGRLVRLKQGDPKQRIDYDLDPVQVALKWQSLGAERLHIVDLDGAFSGEFKNLDLISRITRAVDIKTELGGGARSSVLIKKALDSGLTRVIVGTKAATSLGDVSSFIKEFGSDKVVVSIDQRGGEVKTEGWAASTKLDAYALAIELQNSGVKTLIFTNIKHDGMLTGPDIAGIARLLQTVGISVIISGGIASLDDIKDLVFLSRKYHNLSGAIIGRALYDKTIDFKKANKICLQKE